MKLVIVKTLLLVPQMILNNQESQLVCQMVQIMLVAKLVRLKNAYVYVVGTLLYKYGTQMDNVKTDLVLKKFVIVVVIVKQFVQN
jgi:hypothetical protein